LILNPPEEGQFAMIGSSGLPSAPRFSSSLKSSALAAASAHANLLRVGDQASSNPGLSKARTRKFPPAAVPFRFPAQIVDEEGQHRHAELFYLQKQIQLQTVMVIVLEDGETIEGRIEWYDRNSLKVRGRQKSLIYKSAIKYMYKQTENGQ
jgi:sRNA-binding regulator protein Hfq